MNAEQEVLHLIQNELSKAKGKNPSYSLRAFAKRLHLSPAAVSGILNSRLRVTRRAAEKIFINVQISPDKKKRILESLTNKNGKAHFQKKAVADEAYALLDMDQYHLISDWHYFAILSLAETAGFSDDPKWIAERLNIQIRQARRALKVLERQELLSRGKDGCLHWTGKSFRTTSNIFSSAIRQSHLQNLDLARRSLEQDSVDNSDFTAMTMAIDPNKIQDAKEMIKKFRRELCHYLEAKNKKEVFKLVIQLFPLSGHKYKGEL